mgnify:CR=1 FL=1
MEYKIIVSGCDDSTEVSMELTDEEFKLIQKLAEKITATSSYGCMPTMDIKPEGEKE